MALFYLYIEILGKVSRLQSKILDKRDWNSNKVLTNDFRYATIDIHPQKWGLCIRSMRKAKKHEI